MEGSYLGPQFFLLAQTLTRRALHKGAKPWGPPASVSSSLDAGPGHDGLFMGTWLLLGLLSDRLRKEAWA